jgi:hypothetical protein
VQAINLQHDDWWRILFGKRTNTSTNLTVQAFSRKVNSSRKQLLLLNSKVYCHGNKSSIWTSFWASFIHLTRSQYNFLRPILEGNLLQCLFVHHKFHTTRSWVRWCENCGGLSDIGRHGSRAVKGMHCLRSLGSRDRGFQSHSGHGCLVFVFFCVYIQVAALRRADHPPQGSYGLSKI